MRKLLMLALSLSACTGPYGVGVQVVTTQIPTDSGPVTVRCEAVDSEVTTLAKSRGRPRDGGCPEVVPPPPVSVEVPTSWVCVSAVADAQAAD